MRPRIVPVLLLQGDRLVKTTRFRAPVYLGDPVNLVRLFNDKEADELVLLDISPERFERGPQFEQVERIVSECFMPVCYGGGVRTLADMKSLFSLGVEKVSLNTAAVRMPGLVTRAAEQFGSQSVVVSIDVVQRLFRGSVVATQSARVSTQSDPVAFAEAAVAAGAGEILLTSVDRDGTMKGYDLELVARVANAVEVPVVACGGAGSLADLAAAIRAGASAAAAGSLFVFYGPHRAVLVTYPTGIQLAELFRR